MTYLARYLQNYFKSVGRIAHFANNLTFGCELYLDQVVEISPQLARKVKVNLTENIKGYQITAMQKSTTC